MKTCTACAKQLLEAEFYSKDAKCKPCRRAMVRANREARIEYYRTYDRKRANANGRPEMRKEYQKTEAFRQSHTAAIERWVDSNPEKRRAHTALGNAVRDGRIAKPKACPCGRTENIHGHHDDYNKPLEVRWLCARCHHRLHAEVTHVGQAECR